MKTVQGKWTCGKCGLSNEAAVIAGWVIRCEFCAEPFHTTPGAPLESAFDEHRKRAVVARLRERYSEAREFAPSVPPPDAESFAHLEWILGKQRNPEQDEATLSVEVSELVVLWLQDLARELDNPAFVPGPPVPNSAAASTAGVRQAAADDLRTATRDFAEAFLSPQPSPVGEP